MHILGVQEILLNIGTKCVIMGPACHFLCDTAVPRWSNWYRSLQLHGCAFESGHHHFLFSIQAGLPKTQIGMLTREYALQSRVVFYGILTWCTTRMCEDPNISPLHSFTVIYSRFKWEKSGRKSLVASSSQRKKKKWERWVLRPYVLRMCRNFARDDPKVSGIFACPCRRPVSMWR